VARRHDELERVVDSLRAAGGDAELYAADVTSTVDNQQMVKTAIERFGRLDYAVNNAGTGAVGEFVKMKLEDFDRTMNTNVRSVFLAMQAEIPAMLKSVGGAIVNTASVGGIMGVPLLSAYVASKHAVVGLTKSVALEYATQGIRVNAIAPGTTETAMLSSSTKEHKDTLASHSAMKRIADPIEIARGIVYLLVDATFTTGTVLSAGGGI
jgi:NAD(P)-dependent dehydrogenase (short-subunit alcohol dehydrogenase family)